MNRRQRWRKVLEAEVQRWSALPYDRLLSQLATTDLYEVVDGTQRYQIEIEVLENTQEMFTSRSALTMEAFPHPSCR